MARKNWAIVVQVSDNKWAVHAIGTKTKLQANILASPSLARLEQHNRCVLVRKDNLDTTIRLLNG
jgi:hypothetical protein